MGRSRWFSLAGAVAAGLAPSRHATRIYRGGASTKGGCTVRGRLVLGIVFVMAVLMLLGQPPASQASPGHLRILFASNLPGELDPGIVPAIAAEPGVATVDPFDTSAGTPSPAILATYDLLVSVGDSSYDYLVAWGNELA